MAILFRKNLSPIIHSYISDPQGNYLVCDLTVENDRFTLINLYGPNKDTPNFFDNIINTVETIGNNKIIICGDFNVV